MYILFKTYWPIKTTIFLIKRTKAKSNITEVNIEIKKSNNVISEDINTSGGSSAIVCREDERSLLNFLSL